MECDLGRIIFSYETIGEGRPILMLHGWPLDRSEMVFEMERHFVGREGWRRIYVDLPGMGATPGPEWITCEDEVLEVLEEFIDRVIAGQRFAVAGTSYGGYLACGLVYRRAAQIDGVLLSVPGLLTRPEDLPPRSTVHEDPAVIEEARAAGMGWVEEMAVTQNASLLEYARALQAGAPADASFLERLVDNRELSFDVGRLPEPYRGPALFLTGRQDPGCGYAGAWGLLDRFPRASFAVLDGAGHLMWGEQPAVCEALVNEWLDRVERDT